MFKIVDFIDSIIYYIGLEKYNKQFKLSNDDEKQIIRIDEYPEFRGWQKHLEIRQTWVNRFLPGATSNCNKRTRYPLNQLSLFVKLADEDVSFVKAITSIGILPNEMDRRPKIRHHAAKFDGKKSLQNVHVLQRMPTTSGMRVVFKKGKRF